MPAETRVILNAEHGIPLVFEAVVKCVDFLARINAHWRVSRKAVVWLIALLPLLLLVVPYWSYRPLSAAWAVWLTFCSGLMILLSWRSWDQYLSVGPLFNEVLSATPQDEKEQFERWYRNVFKKIPQLLACLVGSIAVTWAALLLPVSIVERAPVTVGALLVAGFFVGHCMYFIVYTAALCHRIGGLSKIQVTWGAPFSTPGMYQLSAATQLQARLGIMLFLPVAVPLIYAYIHLSASPLKVLYLIAMVIPTLSILVIGLAAQGWLAKPVRHEKALILRDVSSSISSLLAGRSASRLSVDELGEVKGRLELFNLLSSTPDSFLRGEIVSQYAVGFATALVPFVIAFVFR